MSLSSKEKFMQGFIGALGKSELGEHSLQLVTAAGVISGNLESIPEKDDTFLQLSEATLSTSNNVFKFTKLVVFCDEIIAVTVGHL